MKIVEEKLAGAVSEAKILGIGLGQLKDMLLLLYKETE
jgi:hypothetical protein